MPAFAYNQSITFHGDKEVAYKLRSSRAIVTEEMFKAGEEAAKLLDLGRSYYVPRVTNTLASALFSDVELETGISGQRPKVTVSLGIREYAGYGEYVDDGSGIHHTPDPHLPWAQKAGKSKTKEVIHFGQEPAHFTRDAILAFAEPIELIFEAAGQRIARKLG